VALLVPASYVQIQKYKAVKEKRAAQVLS